MIGSMGLKTITAVPTAFGSTLFWRLLVSAVIAGPFILGGVYGFDIRNIPLWVSLFVMFAVGQFFIFRGTRRHRRDPLTS